MSSWKMIFELIYKPFYFYDNPYDEENYMKLLSEKMKNVENFVPIIKGDFINYKRQEINGKYLVKIETSDAGYKTVNKSFLNMLSLINGTNSISDIVEIMLNKYKNVEQKDIENDIYDFLENISKLDALSNIENPFINNYLVELSLNDVIFLSYSSSKKLIKNALEKSNKKIIIYHNPLVEVDMLSYLQHNIFDIRIEMKTYVFVVKRKSKIIGLIIWSRNGTNEVVLDTVVVIEEFDIINALSISSAILQQMLNKSFLICRCYFAINGEEDEEFDFLTLLKALGYRKTMHLENELGENKDVYEYSRYYGKEF